MKTKILLIRKSCHYSSNSNVNLCGTSFTATGLPSLTVGLYFNLSAALKVALLNIVQSLKSPPLFVTDLHFPSITYGSVIVPDSVMVKATITKPSVPLLELYADILVEP